MRGRRARSAAARRAQARVQRARSSPRFSNAVGRDGRARRSRRACAQALATLRRRRAHAGRLGAARCSTALRQLGWHGSRPLRSDEQQTVNRWHALLDEYSALGAVAAARRRAARPWRRWPIWPAERNFDRGQRRGAGDADRVARRSGRALRRHLGRRTRRGAVAAAAAARRLHSAARCRSPPAFRGRAPRRRPARARASLAAWRASTDSAGVLLGAPRRRCASHAEPVAGAHVARTPTNRRRAMPSPLAARAASSAARTARRRAGRARGHRAGPCRRRQTAARCRPSAASTPTARCGSRRSSSKRRRRASIRASAACCCTRRSSWSGSSSTGHFELTGTDDAGAQADDRATRWKRRWSSVFRGYVPRGAAAGGRARKAPARACSSKRCSSSRAARAPFTVEALEARREVSIAGGQFEVRIDRIDSIEGGGFAILDYKSGEPRSLRWQGDAIARSAAARLSAGRARPQCAGAGQCVAGATAARSSPARARARACCRT